MQVISNTNERNFGNIHEVILCSYDGTWYAKHSGTLFVTVSTSRKMSALVTFYKPNLDGGKFHVICKTRNLWNWLYHGMNQLIRICRTGNFSTDESREFFDKREFLMLKTTRNYWDKHGFTHYLMLDNAVIYRLRDRPPVPIQIIRQNQIQNAKSWEN